MNAHPAPPPGPRPRRRGAQPGNQNALKHGYYTTRFKQADQKAYNSCEFTGLAEEIALLRIYIRRVVELGVSVDQLPQSIDLLRALSLAVTSLNRLVKTQLLLSNGEDEISVAIREVFDELTHNPLTAGPPPSLASPGVPGGEDDEDASDQAFTFSLDPDSEDPGDGL